jgi:putative membrane protein
MAYLWTKSIHLLFVMAWVASVFYMPRVLVNLAEAAESGEPEAVRTRLLLMGRRLYTFGHMMFGFAFVFGLLLWQGYRIWPQTFPNLAAGMGWLHAKLGLVAVMLAFFVYCGRALKGVGAGGNPGSSKRWRLWNELPIVLLLAIIYLVLAKPF